MKKTNNQYRTILCWSLLVFILIANKSIAQSNDFGIWTGIEVEKKLTKRFDLSLELANRMKDNLNQRDESFVGTEISYSKKIFSTGLLYRISNVKKNDRTLISHRIGYQIKVKPEFDRFKLEYRGRLQAQYRSINSSSNGHIPESLFRNRFKLEYNIKGLPLTPEFSYEFFYRLNQYTKQQIEKQRYSWGLGYKINKHNDIGVSFIINEQVNVANPETRYIVGIAYKLDI